MKNTVEKIGSILSVELEGVEGLIAQRMHSENAARISEIAAYLISAGGKRIRPLLTLLVAKLCGYTGGNHIKLATSVEFIHTATLLHDDVVDKSPKRRGKAAANLLWDNKSAVLVGDYLFARAFQLMVACNNIKVLDVLANASAVIAEGEVLQLSIAQDITVREETYFKVIHGKTAALFEAATEVGAIIADVPKEQIDAARSYGSYLGLAFQIVDDILDFSAGDSFGKVSGNDFAERKMTLPIIRAIESSKEDIAFWERTIQQGQQEPGDLDQALLIMERCRSIESSKQTALELAQKARACLDIFPDSEWKDLLAELCDFVVWRLV